MQYVCSCGKESKYLFISQLKSHRIYIASQLTESQNFLGTKFKKPLVFVKPGF